MDLRRRGRKRAMPSWYVRPPPVLVHRDTLQFVLRSLLPPPAAAPTSDSGAPSDGDSVADGPARVPVPLDLPAGPAEEDGNDSAFADGELLAPEIDEDDPLAVPAPGPDLAPAAAGPDPAPAAARPDPAAAAARPDPAAAAAQPDPASAAAQPESRCRRRGSPAIRRAPPPGPSSDAYLHKLLHRAAQHAVSSGHRREIVEAFQTLSLLLPWMPRIVWELAFSVCMTGGPGEPAAGPQLQAVLEHCLRHGNMDRIAAQLTAFSALAGAGRTAEALEMVATGRPRCKQHLPKAAAATAVGRLLMQAMKEWARCVQSPPGEARLLHMRTLRGCLETLVAEESLRVALEPLLRSVNAELERG